MAYFAVDRELVDPDYHDGVVASRVEDLMFQNLVGRIKGEVVDWEQKVQVKAFPKAFNAAVAEGTDFNKANTATYTDYVLSHTLEIFRSEGYRVTRHREKMPGHNDKKGMTAAAKKMLDAQNLALSVEVAALSDQEAVAYESTYKTPYMRGALSWLKPRKTASVATDVHSVMPIPLDLVPKAYYEGNVDSLTEALFKAQLVVAKKQRGTGNLSLVGIVGIDLKGIMSGWLGAAANINSGNVRREQPADKKVLQLICDDFVFDGVRVHVMNDDHVANNVSGVPFGSTDFSTSATYAVGDIVKYSSKYYKCHTAVAEAGSWTSTTNWTELDYPSWAPTDQSYKSGIFIDPTMWGFATLEPITHHAIVDEGGGPGGWHETTLRLTCLNPMGQFRVLHTAA